MDFDRLSSSSSTTPLRMKTSLQKLPEELLVEILCRLPPKSLLRFRCVSKSWRSLISDPSFISLQQRHSPSFLLFKLYKWKGPISTRNQYPVLRHGNDPVISDSLPLPQSFFGKRTPLTVLTICNGLLCVSYSDPYSDKPYDDCSALLICNPSIRRFLYLPQPFPHPRYHIITVGFGFDSRNSDYKIIRIASCCCRTQCLSSPMVEVYSLASRCWKTLPPGVAPAASTISAGGIMLKCHAFVNGLAHWTFERRVGDHAPYHFVLSFDFVDEVFNEIELPQSVVQACSRSHNSVVYLVGGFNENSLTMLHVDETRTTGTIWVMKEYGVVESWNKLFYFKMIDGHLEAPSLRINIREITLSIPTDFCITNNGQILLTPAAKRLYLLDVEEKGGIADLQLQGNSMWHCFNTCYAETLVLLDIADSLNSY